MDGLQQMLLIGVTAITFIALFKLAMAFFPLPGFRDIAAFV